MALLLGALGACGGETNAPAVVVSDSAGVRMVQYPADATAPVWQVDTADEVVFGGSADTVNLFRVRSAVQLADGVVLVADNGNHRLAFFDAWGQLVRSEGRQGAGPGEYQDLTAMSLAWPDSLLVWDIRLHRLSVLDGSGAFVRSFPLATTDSVPYPSVSGVYADGSFLVGGSVALTGGMPSGRTSFQVSMSHYGRDGAYVETTGVFPTSETYLETSANAVRITVPVFTTNAFQLTSGNRFVFGRGDRYELRFYRPDGTLVQVLRRAPLARPVTAAARKAEEARILDEMPDRSRDATRKTLESMDAPELIPEMRAAFSDRMGRIWVERFVPGRVEDGVPWHVYGADGTLLGALTLPDGFKITDAGRDYLLGIRTDDLGVESVVRMQLVKS